VASPNIEKSDNSPSLQCLQARMKTTGRDVSFSAVRGRLKVNPLQPINLHSFIFAADSDCQVVF